MGGVAVRRDETLGHRHYRRARAQPSCAQPGDHLVQPPRGHCQEHVVGARHPRREGLDAQLTWQLDPRQVGAVLALGLQQPRLLGGARLQRGAQAAPGEQHRQRGAKGARADHGGALGSGRGQRAGARRARGWGGRGRWLGIRCGDSLRVWRWRGGEARCRLGLDHPVSEPSDTPMA